MTKEIEAQRRRLDILIGTWDTTITPLGADAGEPSPATDSYAWSANGKFVQHDVDAQMGGQRMQSLEILAVDPDTGQYVTRSYDADGSISDFAAKLDGLDWRLIGEQQRFSGRFSADGTALDGEWQQRGEDGWVPLMRVALRKRP